MKAKAARDFNVGDAVVYAHFDGKCEDGVVTFVNDHYVFVRFADMHPAAPGKACLPTTLERAH